MYFRLTIKNKLWQFLPWEMVFLTDVSTFHTLQVLFNQAEVGPPMAKLALLLISFMKYGIVQFLYMNN